MDTISRILILIAIGIMIFNIFYYIYLKKENSLNIMINRENIKGLVISILLAIIIGLAIKTINPTSIIEITTAYYKYIYHIYIVILILMFIELYFYKNSRIKVILKYSNFLSYTTYITLLTLIATNNISLEKFIASIMFASVFYSIKFYSNVFEQEVGAVNERNDESINSKEQLYPQRRTELKHIERYINEHTKNNSCTISICADWGEGKTSFINVIKNELSNSNDYTIFIQPMIMDSRESLIQYFFSQMEFIMKKEGIYTGKGSSINNYFNSIMSIIGKDSKSFFDGIFLENDSKNKDYRELKMQLQRDINKLLSINSDNQGKLVLLVDDFDRVDEDVMYHVLTFIKEIASFKGCLVIFLMDYKNMKGKNITREYLDKFVSKKFELKKVNRNEIINYYLSNNIYFDTTKVNYRIIKSQYSSFKQNIYTYLNNIEKILNDRKININQEISNIRSKSKAQETDDEKIEKLETDVKYIEDNIKRYSELSSNPRKIKKLLIEVEDICKFIYLKYENENEESIELTYNTINCNETIFNMSIIKILFEEEFDELLDSLDISEYIRSTPYTNIVNILFAIDIQDILREINQRKHEEKCKFINNNFINSNRYLESLTEIKTKNKEILQKLNNSSISEEDYEIVNILNAIYDRDYTFDINKIEKEIKLLYDYITTKIDEKKMKFNQVIDDILQHKGRVYYNNYVESIELILNYVILKILNQDNTYMSIKEKDLNLFTIGDFNKNVVFRSSSNISLILRCAKINDETCDYDIINKTIRQNENINNINNLAMNILGMEIDRNQYKESQIMHRWVEECINRFEKNDMLDKKYKQNFKYAHKQIRCLVKVIEILENIDQKINNTKVKPIYKILDLYIFDNVENLEKEIGMLKEHIIDIDKISDIAKVYRYFDQLIANAYKVVKLYSKNKSEDCISERCIVDLKNIYDKLNEIYKEEYIETIIWTYCTLNMIDIEMLMKSKATN